MYKPKILVVEDDPAITNLIRTTLDTQEYQYHTAKNGAGALLDAVSYNPDVIILDLGLPDMDGVEIIRKVRGWSSAPIIIVSARSEDQDKVDALDAGADDYLTKPFSIDEFLARLRVALRRSRTDQTAGPSQSSLYQNGELRIDYAAGCAYMGGKEIHLTPIEYNILKLLLRSPGRVYSTSQIYELVWNDPSLGSENTVAVHIRHLREKLEIDPANPRYIKVVWGLGYKMEKA